MNDTKQIQILKEEKDLPYITLYLKSYLDHFNSAKTDLKDRCVYTACTISPKSEYTPNTECVQLGWPECGFGGMAVGRPWGILVVSLGGPMPKAV